MKLDFRIKSAYIGSYFKDKSKNTFYKAILNKGQYTLIKNDLLKCFIFDKWTDYFNRLGYGEDSVSWSIMLPYDSLSLLDFYKLSNLIRSSTCKTEEQFKELLFGFIDNKDIENKKLKEDVKVVSISKSNYSKENLEIFANGTLF